jgi:ketosteroid isomerase-like protein
LQLFLGVGQSSNRLLAEGETIMTSEQKKSFVTDTWAAFGKGDIKTAFANLSDNVSWLIPGTTPGVSGLKRGKDEILKFMSGVGQLFPEGLNSEIRKVYCDGDTVIVELTNRGKVSNGKTYENEYCFVFELEDDKIRRIREYVDTQRAKEILFS